MTELILEIQAAFREIPVPRNLPKTAKDLEQIAMDLPLMPEDLEKWFLPIIMCDSLRRIQDGEFPRIQIEMVIFAFDPEGSLKEWRTNQSERLLFERRLRFLSGFTEQQKASICRWLTQISSRPEVSSYFRAFQRISNTFCASGPE